jgi:hypothetical protein
VRMGWVGDRCSLVWSFRLRGDRAYGQGRRRATPGREQSAARAGKRITYTGLDLRCWKSAQQKGVKPYQIRLVQDTVMMQMESFSMDTTLEPYVITTKRLYISYKTTKPKHKDAPEPLLEPRT